LAIVKSAITPDAVALPSETLDALAVPTDTLDALAVPTNTLDALAVPTNTMDAVALPSKADISVLQFASNDTDLTNIADANKVASSAYSLIANTTVLLSAIDENLDG
jgi:hypothetical protein